MTGMYYRNTNFSGFDEGENCYPYNIVDLHRFLMGGIQQSRQHGFVSFCHDHPEGPEPSVVMG